MSAVEQRTNRIDEALDELRPSLESDGFTLGVESIDDSGVVSVALTATPDACMDCLVPDDMMVTMLEGVIRDRDPEVTGVVLKKYNI